jgi:glutamine amidotransferase
MCRLYGFVATEPTKVECALVHAQNALISQSRQNMAGFSHAHGWGVGLYRDEMPWVEKQAWAAYHGEHFRRAAARSYSEIVVAHVRRATVGPASLENTHPFVHGRFTFAHNGTIARFERMRPRLLDAMDDLHRSQISGTTDSEHFFRYLLSAWERSPDQPLVETLRDCLESTIAWCREADATAIPSLNVLWSDGDHLVGSRLGRSLCYLERDGVHLCEVCDKTHVRQHHRHRPPGRYRSVEVASEPITGERWTDVPDGTIFTVDPDSRLRFMPLGQYAAEVA